MLYFIILLVVLTIIVVASRKPDSFTISRDGVIDAAPEAVFAVLQDFHQWTHFSPWEAMDPNMARTFSGADQGVGAGYAWSGNKKVGRGSMLITAAEAGKSLLLDLNFEAPMKANNTTRFTLRPEGSGTHLTWSMSGRNAFMNKLFGMVVNIDKLVGKDFERGINTLRAHLVKSH